MLQRTHLSRKMSCKSPAVTSPWETWTSQAPRSPSKVGLKRLLTILSGIGSSCSERPPTCTFAGLEEQIQQFADSDVLRAILDQGCDPREYERQYESQLREAEQGSVQDYIAESENLVMLHDQVRAYGATSSPDAPKTALRRSRAGYSNALAM